MIERFLEYKDEISKYLRDQYSPNDYKIKREDSEEPEHLILEEFTR